MQYFTCPECGKITSKRGIYKNVIKVCNRCKSRLWYISNKQKVSIKSKTFLQLNPNKRREYANKYFKKSAELLSDSYIKRLFYQIGLKDSQITTEMIETKRNIVKIKRLCKQSKN